MGPISAKQTALVAGYRRFICRYFCSPAFSLEAGCDNGSCATTLEHFANVDIPQQYKAANRKAQIHSSHVRQRQLANFLIHL